MISKKGVTSGAALVMRPPQLRKSTRDSRQRVRDPCGSSQGSCWRALHLFWATEGSPHPGAGWHAARPPASPAGARPLLYLVHDAVTGPEREAGERTRAVPRARAHGPRGHAGGGARPRLLSNYSRAAGAPAGRVRAPPPAWGPAAPLHVRRAGRGAKALRRRPCGPGRSSRINKHGRGVSQGAALETAARSPRGRRPLRRLLESQGAASPFLPLQ